MDVIAAPDPRDTTCSPRERPSFRNLAKNPSLKGMRVGVVREFLGDSLHPDLRKAISETESFLASSGCGIVDISLAESESFGLACYYIIAPAEASSNLARFDGVRYGLREDAENLVLQYTRTRGSGFGEEVKEGYLRAPLP